MTGILINLQITILCYVGLGFLLSKTNIIDDTAQKFLIKLILQVLLPLNVFCSFMSNMSLNIIRDLLTVFLAAVGFECAVYVFTLLPMPETFSKSQRNMARYSYLVSNGGLIGTPIIEGLYGSLGVMYCNVFLVPTRIMIALAGETCFNPNLKKDPKSILKAICSNMVIVAICLALFLCALHITIPSPVFTALNNTGKCVSPFSLITIGSILANKVTFDKKIVINLSIISFIRLFAIPLCALCVCKIVHIDFDLTAIMVLLLGMPAGSTGAMYAMKYDSDVGFASATVFITTLLSFGTLILLMQIIELVM